MMRVIKQACRLQKVRPGTPWESYRVSIPKSFVKDLGWENAELMLEVIDGRVQLTAPRKEEKRDCRK